jgi:D-alanyl-D-alanine carboxypeptidase/D-alanyl-D-alanine-endopeptidase (penicillin-binding protein 4)
VFVRAEDGTVLAAQVEDRAVHPASVTKVATTLALLERLGPEYRFETRVLARGAIHDGTLQGDLLVDAGRDPFFVSEGAFLVLCRLHRLGLRTVDGDVRVRGPLLFDWQPDPDGRRLARTLAGREGMGAWPVVAAHDPGCPEALHDATLVFHDHAAPSTAEPTLLVTHRSPPLLHVVKALNEFSNNVFHLVSPAIGGPAVVEAVARSHVPPALRDEIVIDNGAGAGEHNRLSPRAAVALLDALAAWLHAHGKTLTDVLPVSRVDPGTLEKRPAGEPPLPGLIVGKTGTFGSQGASALVGVLRTRRYGTVTFAVLNHGVPVPAARQRQDAFVRALIEATAAEPWPYDRATVPAFFAAQVE